VVFEEGHAEEIIDFAGAAEAEFFVEAHGTLQRRGGVQGDAGAILATKFVFGVGQQFGGDSSALARGKNGHASKMSFALADRLAGDGADDLAGRSLGDENLHMLKTVAEGFGSEHGIEVGGDRVQVAIRREGCVEAGEDFGSVVAGGAANANC